MQSKIGPNQIPSEILDKTNDADLETASEAEEVDLYDDSKKYYRSKSSSAKLPSATNSGQIQISTHQTKESEILSKPNDEIQI